jgi:hypothetical protein
MRARWWVTYAQTHRWRRGRVGRRHALLVGGDRAAERFGGALDVFRVDLDAGQLAQQRVPLISAYSGP